MLRDADCGAFAAGFGLESSICGTAEAGAGPLIVFLHASMWEHIAAAVLSITCVCIWYIVERAQTRNCCERQESSKRNYYIISPRVIIKAIIIIWCAGCFRRSGAFVVGPASTSSEVIRAVLNGWSMAAASLALHVSKTPMLYVPCLVRACLPATCIAYAPGLVSMHIMLSLCRCRGRCVAVAVAVAVADVHCTAASTLPLCMAVMFCTLSCM